MSIRTKTDKPPVTRTEKGKRWATATLVFCGMFSIWANVRSGQMNTESVIVSIVPPIVAFLTSHLISYKNPRTIGQKVLIWGILGLIMIFAMYGSGWHIFDYVVKTGQHWTTGIVYIFITDAPMLVAATILVQKVPSTAQTSTNRTKATASVAKATTAAKKTTAPKATQAAKRTNATKSTKTPNVPDIMMDPFEKDMLTA